MRSNARLSVCAALALAGCSVTTSRQVSGSQTYETHRDACHGLRGEGDGPAAATLRTLPPRFRTLAARNGGEFPAHRVASYIDGRALPAAHGARAMPVRGGVFDATGHLIRGADGSAQRIAAVTGYLRELQDP